VLDRRPSLVTEHWTAEGGAQTKRARAAGERIDGIGGSTVRGLIEAADAFADAGHAPLGVLSGATLTRDVPADHTLTYDDVELVEGSLIVRMRRIQEAMGEVEPPKLSELRATLGR